MVFSGPLDSPGRDWRDLCLESLEPLDSSGCGEAGSGRLSQRRGDISEKESVSPSRFVDSGGSYSVVQLFVMCFKALYLDTQTVGPGGVDEHLRHMIIEISSHVDPS